MLKFRIAIISSIMVNGYAYFIFVVFSTSSCWNTHIMLSPTQLDAKIFLKTGSGRLLKQMFFLFFLSRFLSSFLLARLASRLLNVYNSIVYLLPIVKNEDSRKRVYSRVTTNYISLTTNNDLNGTTYLLKTFEHL